MLHRFSVCLPLPTLLLLTTSATTAFADVKMPTLFGNHMVLQEKATIPVWGWADPGEKISITFQDRRAQVTTGADGKWRADLPAVPEGTQAGELTVTGKNTLKFSDVLVGDVWLFSGQSNMEFGLQNSIGGPEATAKATDSQIRLFRVPHRDALHPCDDVVGSWQVCSSRAASGFSAVAYFFALDLRAKFNRPMGLIESAYSGSSGQAWVALEALQSNPSTSSYVDGYNKVAAAYPGGQSQMDGDAAAFATANGAWHDKINKDPTYQDALKAWNAAIASAKQSGQPLPAQPAPPVPQPAPPPQADAHTPAMLYNGMIAPLIPYRIKGVLWYQGESNTGVPMAFDYRNLLGLLISDWRKHWEIGDFPFVVIQLPNFSDPPKSAGAPSSWAVLRESQLHVLTFPNTGLVVTIDLGDGKLHPPDKIDVGRRAALVARHLAYDEKLVYIGPMYKEMQITGSSIQISFQPDSIGGGLIIGSSPRPGAPPRTGTLQGFAIAGADHKWVWADAKIVGDQVIVSSSQVAEPIAVRYAWAQNPSANLYNKEGLPASPFRTDAWDPFK